MEERRAVRRRTAVCLNSLRSGPARRCPTSRSGRKTGCSNRICRISSAPEAVAAMVASDGQQSLIRQGCARVQAFPLVTIDGDTATATGYSRVYRFRDGAHEIWRISANRWEFRRTSLGWRITRRVNHVIDGGPEAHELLNGGLD